MSNKFFLFDIIEKLPVHIYWKDQNGILLGCNGKTLESFGLKSESEYIGKTDYNLFSKKQADELTKLDREVMKTGNTIIAEEISDVSTGIPALFLSIKTPLKNNAEEVCGIIGVSINITDIKKDELNELFLLKSIIALMPGHVYWKDRAGNYLGCNNEQARALGLSSPDEIKQKKPYDDLSQMDSERLRENDSVVFNQAETITLEEAGIRENGEEGIFLTKKTPLYDEADNVVGLLGVSFDITERKKAEEATIKAKEAAEAANILKTEFVQNMQHDIRTPASGVWSLLETIGQQVTDPKMKEVFDLLRNSSKQLLKICDDVVDFENIQHGERPITEKKMDIRELVTGIFDLNKPAGFSRGLTLNLKVSADLPLHIMSDEFRLSRILINLLGNSIKFTNQGSVTLSLYAKEHEVKRYSTLCIDIIDTGIGIDPSKIGSIFDKFTRGVPSNTNLYPGTGIGLFLVKKFVEDLEGDLDVESVLGQGSHFSVAIPFKTPLLDLGIKGIELDETYTSPVDSLLEDLQSTAIPNAMMTTQDLKKQGILQRFPHQLLFIEDDKTALFSTVSMLSELLDFIDTAETVVEAKRKLKEKKYDLVISDLGLPDGTGIDIVHFAEIASDSLNKETPFIALTAHIDAAKQRAALDAGFSDVAAKPLTLEKGSVFLKTYPLDGAGKQSADLELPVIDLKLGMQRIGASTPDKAIKALEILTFSLAEEIPRLQAAEREKDIEQVRFILHKLRGGLFYTGTPRLEKIIDELQVSVKILEDLSSLQDQFQIAYEEVRQFEESYRDLIKTR